MEETFVGVFISSWGGFIWIDFLHSFDVFMYLQIICICAFLCLYFVLIFSFAPSHFSWQPAGVFFCVISKQPLLFNMNPTNSPRSPFIERFRLNDWSQLTWFWKNNPLVIRVMNTASLLSGSRVAGPSPICNVTMSHLNDGIMSHLIQLYNVIYFSHV